MQLNDSVLDKVQLSVSNSYKSYLMLLRSYAWSDASKHVRLDQRAGLTYCLINHRCSRGFEWYCYCICDAIIPPCALMLSCACIYSVFATNIHCRKSIMLKGSRAYRQLLDVFAVHVADQLARAGAGDEQRLASQLRRSVCPPRCVVVRFVACMPCERY